MCRARLAAFAAALALATQAHAIGSNTLVAELRGAQENPPVATAARGCGMFVIDRSVNTLSYYIVFTGLSSPETAAHIHASAPPGMNAGVVHPLPAGNPKVGVWNYPEAMEDEILDGRTYVNIHTAMHPGGEIRGQIGHFAAVLNGAQEVPSNTSTGRGWATFTIDTDANLLNYYIVVESLTGTESAAHIHATARHGQNAGVVHPLPAGSPKVGTWNYPEAMEQVILDGRTYVNVHTMPSFPGGEIRGQICNIVVPIDGMQETPPVATGAAGIGMFTIDRAGNQLSYHIESFNLSSPEAAAHIHGFAPRGAPAGVVHPLPAGSPKVGSWNYPEVNEPDILSGLTYVNIHTMTHGGGEIRGQIEIGTKRPCPADLDGDGVIGLGDLGILLAAFGINDNGDVDGDGDTDLADLGIVLSLFGRECP